MIALAGAFAAATTVPDAALAAGPLTVRGGEAATADGVHVVLTGRGDVPAALAAAYRRDGLAALNALRGEWIAVVWDGETLVLATDPLGGRSLHYAASGAGIVFGEDARDVLALLPATPAPDRAAAAAWLARAQLPPDGTLYSGVRRAVPGRALRLRGGTTDAPVLWQPRFAPPLTDAPAEQLRDAVDAAVGRAASDAPGVLLSGGLDSATVAASLVHAGRPPVAYSATFPGHPEADETEQLDALTAHLGLDSVRAAVTGGRPDLGALRYLAEWRLPCASPNSFIWVPLLRAAAADGVDVMLDGEGGDELFGSQPFHVLADLAARGRLLQAWRLTARYPGVRGRRRRARVLAHFLRTELRLETTASGGPRWWRHRVDQLTHQRHALDMPGTLRRIAALAPLPTRHPLLVDRDLVELALRLPPEASFDRHFNRPLARAAQEGRLPDAVRLRRGKSHLSGVLQAALPTEPLDRVREFADIERLRADPARLGELWRATALEGWLRELESPGFAASQVGQESDLLEHRLARTDVDPTFKPDLPLAAAFVLSEPRRPKGTIMDRELRNDYETPTVTDHGDLTELTLAGAPDGFFDANYQAGDPIPPGGAGNGLSQP